MLAGEAAHSGFSGAEPWNDTVERLLTFEFTEHRERPGDNLMNTRPAEWQTEMTESDRFPVSQARRNSIERARFGSPAELSKRTIDIVAAFLLLLFFLPFFGAVALVIMATDGGGIFFAHTRIGRDGRAFKCLKFRSMRSNASELLADILANDPDARRSWEVQRKLPNDPRILPGVGRLLRKSSLDELPQLINVLRGDMSLVGPRPVMRDELSYYGADARWYYSVRPGITGPWQISGRSDTSYVERVTMDVDYARNWTVGKDIVILLRTPPAVLFGGGAY